MLHVLLLHSLQVKLVSIVEYFVINSQPIGILLSNF